MGINVGSLNASLTLQSAQFMTAMKDAAKQSKATALAITSAMDTAKGAVKGLAAVMSVDMFAKSIKGAFDYADAIDDLSTATGASRKFIQEFGYAAQLSGASVEMARSGLEKFSKMLGAAQNGNQKAAKTMQQFGITSSDVDTAVRQAANGISKLNTQSAQAAATSTLFGKANQKLTATMAQGADGLNVWAKKAAELGIVLDGDLIQNAGKVNDKLDTLKMIVDAKFANMIVKNADAIASLADSVTKLVTSLIDFWGQHPQAAASIMGALAGGALGGVPGAVLGGAAGAYAGHNAAMSMADSDMSLDGRKAKLLKAKDDYAAAKDGAPGLVQGTAAELNRQWDLYRHAVAVAKAGNGKPVTGNIPPPVDPNAAKKAAQAKKAFDTADLQERLGVFGLQGQLETDPRLAANLRHQAIGLEYGQYDANGDWQRGAKQGEIDDALSAGTYGDPKGKLAQARAEELKHQLDLNGQLEHAVINRELDQKLSEEDLKSKTAALQNEKDILEGAQALARTQAERRDIGLKIIAANYEQEKATLEAVVASKSATEAEKQIAQKRLDILGTLKGQDEEKLRGQTMGPMESYLDQMPKTLGEINESVQAVAVDGFGQLNDGIAKAITGAGSLGSAFSNLATTVIEGLAKIAIEQAIIKPLGGLLFGGSGGGLIGSIFGGIFGHRANGGMTSPGNYMVGERGPEMISVGNTSRVTTTRELRAAANDNSGGTNVIFQPGSITGSNAAEMQMYVMAGIAKALPVITKQATDATITKLRRPSL